MPFISAHAKSVLENLIPFNTCWKILDNVKTSKKYQNQRREWVLTLMLLTTLPRRPETDFAKPKVVIITVFENSIIDQYNEEEFDITNIWKHLGQPLVIEKWIFEQYSDKMIANLIRNWIWLILFRMHLLL